MLAIGIMLAAGPFYTGRDNILRAFQTPDQQAVIVVLHHDGGNITSGLKLNAKLIIGAVGQVNATSRIGHRDEGVVDERYVRRTAKGLRLTPWANAHVDACCLRFIHIYEQCGIADYRFGAMNSDEEYNHHYFAFAHNANTLSDQEKLLAIQCPKTELENTGSKTRCNSPPTGGFVVSQKLNPFPSEFCLYFSFKTMELGCVPSF